MKIVDLSFLENIEGSNILGSTGVNIRTRIDKNVDIKKNVKLNVDKFVRSIADPKGNLATAEASADAFGKDTLAETDVFTQTTDRSSESFAEALSATR
jgi:hypothetical protein